MDDETHEKKLVMQFFASKAEGFFVEVGANDPKGGSQTWNLERAGWRGILVEPNPRHIPDLEKTRKRSTVVETACTSPEKVGSLTLYIPSSDGMASTERHIDDQGLCYETQVTVSGKTLDAVLEEAQAPSPIDFVSIDVEGTELDVLRGFTLSQWKPKLILLEDKLRNLTKHNYLKKQGYKLVKRTSINNWYVPSEFNFNLTNTSEQLNLFRKVYLGLPFRMLRQWRHSSRKIRC